MYKSCGLILALCLLQPASFSKNSRAYVIFDGKMYTTRVRLYASLEDTPSIPGALETARARYNITGPLTSYKVESSEKNLIIDIPDLASNIFKFIILPYPYLENGSYYFHDLKPAPLAVTSDNLLYTQDLNAGSSVIDRPMFSLNNFPTCLTAAYKGYAKQFSKLCPKASTYDANTPPIIYQHGEKVFVYSPVFLALNRSCWRLGDREERRVEVAAHKMAVIRLPSSCNLTHRSLRVLNPPAHALARAEDPAIVFSRSSAVDLEALSTIAAVLSIIALGASGGSAFAGLKRRRIYGGPDGPPSYRELSARDTNATGANDRPLA